MTCFFCRCAVNPIMCLDLKVHFDINTATKHIFSFSIYAFNSILFPIDAISNFFLLYLDMMLLSSTSLDFKNSIWELLLIDESSSLMIITDIFRHFAILFCIFITVLLLYIITTIMLLLCFILSTFIPSIDLVECCLTKSLFHSSVLDVTYHLYSFTGYS